MSREPFIWNEIEHWTLADLMETLYLIESDEDAESFFMAFAEACDSGQTDKGDEIAMHNIRYILDIIARNQDDEGEGDDVAEAERIAELFQVDLPGENEILSPIQTFGNSSLGVKTHPTKTPKPTEDEMTEDEFNAAVEAVEAGDLTG